jgi:hypothetical protein
LFSFPCFSTGISDAVPCRFLLQTGSNTTTITGHHYHHFPTLSLEHLNLSLRSNLALHFLRAYYTLDSKYLCRIVEARTVRHSRWAIQLSYPKEHFSHSRANPAVASCIHTTPQVNNIYTYIVGRGSNLNWMSIFPLQ